MFTLLRNALLLLVLPVMLAGCGTLNTLSTARLPASQATRPPASAQAQERGNNVVLYTLGMIDTGYRFGGKNPDAGFDCSGMVSYIFAQAAGVRVSGSAADIARQSRPVDLQQLRPGDLVFFNTLGRPFSHVGIYIGNDRFVHAPSSSGQARVRTESLKNRYFAQRLEAARSLLE
ncbi:MAG: C40 family peptidase [Sterolibacterium sp.]|nr:C40 family peptidase [Sterolibacterium sp.]